MNEKDEPSSCPFRNLSNERIVEKTEYSVLINDGYPVTEGHSLIIPVRHVEDYFELSWKERNDINRMLLKRRNQIQTKYPEVAGFNVGINIGTMAGQTVMHAHVHLIPRRQGDVNNPRGGVRGVVPDRQDYKVEG